MLLLTVQHVYSTTQLTAHHCHSSNDYYSCCYCCVSSAAVVLAVTAGTAAAAATTAATAAALQQSAPQLLRPALQTSVFAVVAIVCDQQQALQTSVLAHGVLPG
jgi:hypothetical protein